MEHPGLTTAEAAGLRLKFGPNTYSGRKTTALDVFLRQFNNSIVYLLMVAALAAFITADITDGLVISVILVFNTLLGFVREYRSETTLDKLSRFIDRHIIVIRDNKHVILNTGDLVPGDVILVKTGDIIPADARILTSTDLLVNESPLTGESQPVHKQITDPVYSGSVVEKGEARALVQATGNSAGLGKIALLTTQTEKVTPFGQSLNDFSGLLLKIALTCIVSLFLIKTFILHSPVTLTQNLIFMFALTIGIIPEVLPVIVTIALSAGADRLSKKHVLIKKLSALEDFGNVTLLCTDKTGTLTENHIIIDGIVAGDPEIAQILVYASIDDPDKKHHKYTDAYDLAMEKYISPALKSRAAVYKKIQELPYDSVARRKWVILQNINTLKYLSVEIGSAQAILSDSGAKENKLLLETIARESNRGFRHQAVAYSEIDYHPGMDVFALRHHSKLAGILRLTDPLRPGTKMTVRMAKDLGISIKILTGDTRETAAFVGRQIGLISDGDSIITGGRMRTMTENQLQKLLPATHVFAELTPEDKHTLVKLFKKDQVVAYQGDGINDAPALKAADVAIAVDTATDIAKENADVVLLKRDLEVIISGIKSGRTIFANINKYLRFTMIGNFSFFFTLAWLYLRLPGLPLNSSQVLLISSFSQIPLITISGDHVDSKELLRPGIYQVKKLLIFTLVTGFLTSVYQLLYYNFHSGRTEFFLFLLFTQLIVVFYIRNRDFFWQTAPPSVSLIVAAIFTFLVSTGLPALELTRRVFSLSSIGFASMTPIFLFTLLYLFIADFAKVIYYRYVIREFV